MVKPINQQEYTSNTVLQSSSIYTDNVIVNYIVPHKCIHVIHDPCSLYFSMLGVNIQLAETARFPILYFSVSTTTGRLYFLKACPHLIRIRSTSISNLNPLRTKLEQYWINPFRSHPHYELNSWQFVHKAQFWSCDSILATCWYIVLFLNIPSSWLWTLSAPRKYNNAFVSCILQRPLDIFYNTCFN